MLIWKLKALIRRGLGPGLMSCFRDSARRGVDMWFGRRFYAIFYSLFLITYFSVFSLLLHLISSVLGLTVTNHGTLLQYLHATGGANYYRLFSFFFQKRSLTIHVDYLNTSSYCGTVIVVGELCWTEPPLRVFGLWYQTVCNVVDRKKESIPPPSLLAFDVIVNCIYAHYSKFNLLSWERNN